MFIWDMNMILDICDVRGRIWDFYKKLVKWKSDFWVMEERGVILNLGK